MYTHPFKLYMVNERSRIMEVKSVLATTCRRLGLTEHQTGKVEIVASEIMTNQLKYGLNGMILFRTIKKSDEAGIEILGIDSGPGMQNVWQNIKDGVSSGESSLGTGLGAINRFSSEFDIYSYPDKGTVIYSLIRFREDEPAILFQQEPSVVSRPRKKEINTGVLSVCYPGADVCGDMCATMQKAGNHYFFISDGLGHGVPAHEASRKAVESFTDSEKVDLRDILTDIHHGMEKTRGGVGAMLRLNLNKKRLAYCGVGNITGKVIHEGKAKSLISVSGTLGYNMPRQPLVVEQDIVPPAVVVLHSDGLKNSWVWSDYPGLQSRHPLVIAAVLYRDSKVTRDDQMAVVIKINKV
ncbi:ATP-binding protein [Roseivirga sp. BDSF3-8]|uniref:ATP-binding protein n=1 Tax=Roseivirga sp. BDSF3-8 TaxID=3241598 RepID=UPI0035319E55